MRRIALIALIIACCLAMLPIGNAAQAQQEPIVHIVQQGENLFRISLRYGVPISVIAAQNGITNVNRIFVGQRLIISGGAGVIIPPTQPPTTGTGIYVVQRGDTLARIARRFNTTVAALAQLNGIVNVNLIFVGQQLRVPSGDGAVIVPTQAPGGTPAAGFEIGGQIQGGLTANSDAVMKSARMTWVKRQFSAGDAAAVAFIGEAKGAGYKVLLSIVGDKNRVLDPAFQNEYAAYVANLARSGADAIQVWNEMNIDREWPQGQINPASYVQLLQKAYTAIKEANPNTLVITGAPAPTGAEGAFGLARVWNDDRYYNGMAAAGAARFADCIGVHYNEGIVSPTATTGDPRGDNYPTRYFLTMLQRALAPFPGKQACFSELGYLSPEGYGPLPANFAWAANTTAQRQAQFLGEAVRVARNTGRVRLLIVFNIDFTNYGDDPQAGYAIIRPGNICLACATIAANAP
jgi:LysM repeat protein